MSQMSYLPGGLILVESDSSQMVYPARMEGLYPSPVRVKEQVMYNDTGIQMCQHPYRGTDGACAFCGDRTQNQQSATGEPSYTQWNPTSSMKTMPTTNKHVQSSIPGPWYPMSSMKTTPATQQVKTEHVDEWNDDSDGCAHPYRDGKGTCSFCGDVQIEDQVTPTSEGALPTDDDYLRCTHPFRNHDGVCGYCGEWFAIANVEAKPKERAKRGVAKSILPDLAKRDFPEDINREAEKVYKEIIATGLRKRSKEPVIFYCVLQAHKRLSRTVVPNELAKKFGIERSEASKTISYYNSIISYCTSFTEPAEMILYYCKKMDISTQLTELMIAGFNSLMERCPGLRERAITSTVAAFIYYYLTMYGMVINDEKYAEVFDLSFSTIDNVKSLVCQVDNTQ